MYRTINKLLFSLVFLVASLSLQHVYADTLKTVKQVKESVNAREKVSMEREESLAVELLLRDLEITIDDTATDTAKKTTLVSQSVKIDKKALKNNKGEKKIQMPSEKKDVSKSNMSLSAKKVFNQIWSSIPGAEFFKKNFKSILIMLFIVIGVVAVIFFFHWRRDIGRFLTTGRLSIMDKEVQRACDYIEENYANQELSIESICVALVTGEAFLQALFNQELGISVENFIIQVRVNRIKHSVNKDQSIDNEPLAQMVGFADVKTMEDQFQTITGASLDIFRKSLS